MDGNKIETQRNTIYTQYEYIGNTIEIQQKSIKNTSEIQQRGLYEVPN